MSGVVTALRVRRPEEVDRARLRAWLEYVVQTGIDWLDELDAAEADLEDDEREFATEDDRARPSAQRRRA